MSLKPGPAVAEATHNAYYGVGGFTAVIAFFANYVNFKGRSSRREFWWYSLFLTLFSMITGILMSAYITAQVITNSTTFEKLDPNDVWGLFKHLPLLIVGLSVIFVIFFLPTMSLGIRRFRDAGIHWGLYVALYVIDLAASVIFINNNKMMWLITGPVAIVMLIIDVLPSKAIPK